MNKKSCEFRIFVHFPTAKSRFRMTANDIFNKFDIKIEHKDISHYHIIGIEDDTTIAVSVKLDEPMSMNDFYYVVEEAKCLTIDKNTGKQHIPSIIIAYEMGD